MKRLSAGTTVHSWGMQECLGKGGSNGRGKAVSGQVLSESMGNAFLERSESQKHFLSNNKGVTVKGAHDNRALSVALFPQQAERNALLLWLHTWLHSAPKEIVGSQ